jgi:hypothetical protein
VRTVRTREMVLLRFSLFKAFSAIVSLLLM